MKTTRREALGMLGAAAGAVIVAPLVAGRAFAARENQRGVFPWPYLRLDPTAVGERAYDAYLEGHCMYGTFTGIVGELAAKKGTPYNTFPFEMMKYGQGGVVDWATLCGALNGCAAAIYLLSPDPRPLIDELFGWYQDSMLPDFRPRDADMNIRPSIARSTLCHLSVSRWCKSSGFGAYSSERAERCAWMASSCARKSVELLNLQQEGRFVATHNLPDNVKECRQCHDKGGVRENSRGKMGCTSCHTGMDAGHQQVSKQAGKY